MTEQKERECAKCAHLDPTMYVELNKPEKGSKYQRQGGCRHPLSLREKNPWCIWPNSKCNIMPPDGFKLKEK